MQLASPVMAISQSSYELSLSLCDFYSLALATFSVYSVARSVCSGKSREFVALEVPRITVEFHIKLPKCYFLSEYMIVVKFAEYRQLLGDFVSHTVYSGALPLDPIALLISTPYPLTNPISQILDPLLCIS